MQQVIVIGGGVVGLTSAWWLLEAGYRVTLLERAPELGTGTSYAMAASSATATCRRWPTPACR
jgi:glycine/D-amino acid oxidase-like deaminating enzyme